MSNYLKKYLCERAPILTVFGVLLALTSSLVSETEAFQVRQADNLRIMQSKPYAQSANFRVNADMFIQPSKKIRSADLVTQAPAPAPEPTVPAPTLENNIPPVTAGGNGNDGGEKYDASDWILAQKYEELVRERDESFLTSAPEDPELQFDYVPTNPDLVERLEYDPFTQTPNPIEPVVDSPSPSIPTSEITPEANSDSDSYIPNQENAYPVSQPAPPSVSPTFDQAVFESEPIRLVSEPNYTADTAEQALIASPRNEASVMVVPLSNKQKKALMKAQAEGFVWPWTNRSEKVFEEWQTSAPLELTMKTDCVNCENVLWWTWCQFVVLCLTLILLLVLLNTMLQIVILRYKRACYKPVNPKSFKYKFKKLLQNLGLLSLLVVTFNSFEAQAQTTTSPQTLIYEGELLDDLGDPAVGSYTFRFSFWDNADYEATDVTGGVLNTGVTDYRGWTEVQTTDTIADGSFSLQLSDVTPFTAGLFDQDNLYLQVEIKSAGAPDSDFEFVDIDLGDNTVDRIIIASVPFAFNANKLDYRELGFGAGNIPYLDLSGLLPESVIPDLNLTADDLDLTDITLSDFTNDLALNDGQVLIGDATNTATPVTVSGDGSLDNAGVFTLNADSVGADELDFGNVTLADFTNDAGFLSTVDISDNTNLAVGSGATLTDDTLTINLGDTVEGSEITDGTITAADLDLSDITLTDFTNDAGFVTTDSDVLGNLACAANEIAKWNGSAWICSPDAGGTSYTASNGITLTGSNFTSDLGTDIETAEIQDDAVTPDKLGGAGADQVLTSDALGNPQWEDRSNFAVSALTTDNIFVGDGGGEAVGAAVTGDLTMTGGNFQINTGAVTSAEIADNTILADDLAPAFTITGAQITDGSINADDLGTDAVGTDEIADDAVDGSKISLAGEAVGDLMYFDGTDWITLPTGTAGQVLQVNATADAPEWVIAAAGDFAGLSDTNFTGLTAGEFAIFDGTNWINLPATGDITISAGGVATITADAITGTEILDGSVDVSDDTNLNAGTGLTLVDDTLSADLGSTIDSSEIEADTITALDIAPDAITASELADNAVDTAAIVDGAITDEKIDLTDVTLADFTNDAGFMTTDNDTTYTAGTGLNLVGTTFSSVLGSTIESSEITNNSIQGIDLDFGDITLADFTNDAGFLTSVDISDDTNLTAGTGATLIDDTISVDLGTDIETSEIQDSAVTSAKVLDDSLTADDLADNSVSDAEIDYTNVTLADFTNDAGFLTSADISDDTNLTAGAGATLIDDTLSVDLGTDIETAELQNDAVTSAKVLDGTLTADDLGDDSVGDAEMNFTEVTLADFTNDTGYLTTVDISDDTNLAAGNGIMLIGDSIIAELGSTVTSGEIEDGTIVDADLNLANITLNDFTNDAGYLTAVDISDDTNLTAGTGLTLTGDSMSANLGDSIDATEIETDAVGEDEIDFTNVTLSDFTNDAGFITTASDTLDDLSCGINEIAKWNGVAWVCAADAGGTTYSATDGITLTGAVFTNDFSTSIESNEITDGTIEDQDLNFAEITLADFTNDAGFVTSDTLADLSCNDGEIARWNGTAWECAGAPVEVTEILTPRYPNSIFSADGSDNTGSMYEEDETLAAGFLGTIIRWFSRQVVLNDYDVIVEWTVPDDFESFQDPGLSLDYRTEGTVADSVIDMIVQQNNSGIDEISAGGMSLNSNSWTTTNLTLNAGTTWNPGDVMKIRMRMKARQSNSASIGNIKIKYNRK